GRAASTLLRWPEGAHRGQMFPPSAAPLRELIPLKSQTPPEARGSSSATANTQPTRPPRKTIRREYRNCAIDSFVTASEDTPLRLRHEKIHQDIVWFGRKFGQQLPIESHATAPAVHAP